MTRNAINAPSLLRSLRLQDWQAEWCGNERTSLTAFGVEEICFLWIQTGQSGNDNLPSNVKRWTRSARLFSEHHGQRNRPFCPERTWRWADELDGSRRTWKWRWDTKRLKDCDFISWKHAPPLTCETPIIRHDRLNGKPDKSTSPLSTVLSMWYSTLSGLRGGLWPHASEWYWPLQKSHIT